MSTIIIYLMTMKKVIEFGVTSVSQIGAEQNYIPLTLIRPYPGGVLRNAKGRINSTAHAQSCNIGEDLTDTYTITAAESTTKMQRMIPSSLAVLLLLRFYLAYGQATAGVRPIGENDNGICEGITEKYCANIRSQNTVYLPNARGHYTQTKASEEFDDYLPLITPTPCSNGLYHFLCSYYFPLCYNDSLNSNRPTKLKPCRSLCEYVRPPCEAVLLENGYSWPVFLNCSLDDFGDGTCFGPPDPSTARFTTIDIAVPTMGTIGTSGAVKNVVSVLFVVIITACVWTLSR